MYTKWGFSKIFLEKIVWKFIKIWVCFFLRFVISFVTFSGVFMRVSLKPSTTDPPTHWPTIVNLCWNRRLDSEHVLQSIILENFTFYILIIQSDFNYLIFCFSGVCLSLHRVSGQLPQRKIAPRLGLGFGLGLTLEIVLGDNFPRGQLS